MGVRRKWRLPVLGFLALILAAALAACGSSSSDDSGTQSSSGEGGGTTSASADVPSWCGDEDMTLALSFGFGESNWYKIARAEAEDEAAKCPAVKDIKYSDGQGDTQKAISDIEGMAAQGVNAMIVHPFAGKAQLPALTSAHNAGVVVVPFNVNPGGEAGTNYDFYLSTNYESFGEEAGKWMIKTLGNKGTLLSLGGPAGNSASTEVFTGVRKAVEGSGIKLIGEQPFTVTDWDPAKTQQVITAALAKYPEIDGIITDYGAALASALPVFKQAKREIPAIAAQDSNQLSCDQVKLGFPLFTVSSMTWHIRDAVKYAVAKASGGEVKEPPVIDDPPFEDSVSGKPNKVQCDKELSGEAILSSKLSRDQLAKVLQ